MSGDVFTGVISGFPEISVDYFLRPTCSLYFLSHCHTDHIKGLDSKEFATLSQSTTVRIYCTSTTASLVKNRSKLPHLDPLFVLVEVGEQYTIPLSDTQSMEVWVYDAAHCPGSAMFLFSRQGGERALYTGDFRLSDIHDDTLVSGVTSLYLDTTFFSPRIPAFRKFPSRRDSEMAAVRFVEKERERGGSVHVDVIPGWENIFISLSEHFECDIQTTSELLSEYTDLHPILIHLTTDNSWIHVNKTNTECKLCADNTVKLRPSVQWKLHNNTLDTDTMIAAKAGEKNVWYVTHSMHSSYSECVQFIERVGAERVYPIATPARTTNEDVVRFCRKYWKTVTNYCGNSVVDAVLSAQGVACSSKDVKEEVMTDDDVMTDDLVTTESDDCLPILIIHHDQPEDRVATATHDVVEQMARAVHSDMQKHSNAVISVANDSSENNSVGNKRKQRRRKRRQEDSWIEYSSEDEIDKIRKKETVKRQPCRIESVKRQSSKVETVRRQKAQSRRRVIISSSDSDSGVVSTESCQPSGVKLSRETVVHSVTHDPDPVVTSSSSREKAEFQKWEYFESSSEDDKNDTTSKTVHTKTVHTKTGDLLTDMLNSTVSEADDSVSVKTVKTTVENAERVNTSVKSVVDDFLCSD